MEVKLGTIVKDEVSGFTGVATARAVYHYGCVRVLVEPRVLKDGKLIEGEWIDEARVIMEGPQRPEGGGPSPPPRRDPPK